MIGTLTKDPELSERADTKICDLRVADHGRKDSPVFIDVSVFQRQAEVCSQYLSKGRQVAVTGQLRYSEWEAEDGSKHSKHSIVADRVDFLTSDKRRGSDKGSE